MRWLDSTTDSVDMNLSKLRGRPGFSFWVGKIPWRKERLPTPVFLLEEFHGQRSLAGYSPRDRRVGLSWMTNKHFFFPGDVGGQRSLEYSVHGFPKSRAQLSDWTTNISIKIHNNNKKSLWTVSSRNILFFTYTHWITQIQNFFFRHVISTVYAAVFQSRSQVHVCVRVTGQLTLSSLFLALHVLTFWGHEKLN